MGLHYFPFWLEIWWKDYKVQSLPRNVRLIFYDILCLLWDRDMRLPNDDNSISYYLRVTPEEWLDAKRILLKHDLIQLVQANKRIDCHRLGMSYEDIIDGSARNAGKARFAAKKRWEKQRENK